MKTLEPLVFKASYYASVEKDINRFFYFAVFKPLIDSIKEANIPIKNSNDPVFDALQSGKVYYQEGKFIGDFNSKIVSELRKLGAVFDRKDSSYTLGFDKLPAQLRIGAQMAESNLAAVQKTIIERLDNVDVVESLKQYEFDFDGVAKTVNADLERTLKKVAVGVKFTPEQYKIIKDEWQENLKLYVKDWSDEAVLSMRRQVTENIQAGNRAKSLEKVIMQKYNSSKKKAKFLARQETSLLVSKMRETRYKDSGLSRYIWVTNMDGRERDMHAALNGQIIDWANPPIVDEQGNRKHAGEDFNCRCVAKPILD